jgi:hypothetical protein
VEAIVSKGTKALNLGFLRMKRTVSPEEIESSFTSAGWHLDGSFEHYMVIGYTDDGLSILAGKEAWDTDYDPVFELIDHERERTYEVHEIPTPQQAKKMLQEHSLPLREGEV